MMFMDSRYALLAIPFAAILGLVLLSGLNENGETIEVNVFDGLGFNLLGIFNQPEKSGITLTGSYDLVVKDQNGFILSEKHVDNLVVDIGVQTVADQIFPNIDLNSSTQNQFSYLGIGTGSTAPVAGDTDVETAIGGCGRIQDTLVEGSFASNTATITIDASFSGANCAGTIQEAVLANAATGGQILSRVLTGSVVVGAGDTLDLTYTFTIKDDGV